MKCLLDMPVSPMLLDVLDDYGHEGVHAHQRSFRAIYVRGG